jgi:hypothetical protein
MIGNSRRDHRSIGEKRDQEAAFLGLCINVQEILARENLSAGVQNPQATHLQQFIEQSYVFLKRQFSAPRVGVTHRQIVVAMLAFERAAMRYLDGHLHRSAAPLQPFVDRARKISVGSRLNQLSLFLSLNLESLQLN